MNPHLASYLISKDYAISTLNRLNYFFRTANLWHFVRNCCSQFTNFAIGSRGNSDRDSLSSNSGKWEHRGEWLTSRNSPFLRFLEQTIQAKNRRKKIMKKIKTAKSFIIRLRLLNLLFMPNPSPPTRSAHTLRSPDIPYSHSPLQHPNYHRDDPPSLPAP